MFAANKKPARGNKRKSRRSPAWTPGANRFQSLHCYPPEFPQAAQISHASSILNLLSSLVAASLPAPSRLCVKTRAFLTACPMIAFNLEVGMVPVGNCRIWGTGGNTPWKFAPERAKFSLSGGIRSSMDNLCPTSLALSPDATMTGTTNIRAILCLSAVKENSRSFVKFASRESFRPAAVLF